MGRRWTLTGAAPDSGQPVVMYACQRWGLKFADESYIGHKNKSSRAIGTYKRSKSAAVLQTNNNNNNYKIAGEGDNTAFPEPKLGQQSWNSEGVLPQSDAAAGGGDSLGGVKDGSQSYPHNERIGTIPEYAGEPVAPVRPARPSVHGRHSVGHTSAPTLPSATPVSNINNNLTSSSSSAAPANMFTAKPFEQPAWAARRESPRRQPPPPPVSPPFDPLRSNEDSPKGLVNNNPQSQYSPQRRNVSNDSSSSNSWLPHGSSYNSTTSSKMSSPSSSQENHGQTRPSGHRSPNNEPFALPPRDYQRRESAPVRPVASAFSPDSKLSVPQDLSSPSRRRSDSSMNSTPRSDQNSDGSLQSSSSHSRQPSQEELECDEKAKQLAQDLKDKERKLSEVLRLNAKEKRMAYMDGLFSESSDCSSPVEKSSFNVDTRNSVKNKSPQRTPEKADASDNSKRSSLPKEYWVSPSKAILEMELRKNEDVSKDITKDINDSNTLMKQKEELMESLHKKLEVLKEAKVVLQQEIDDNDQLGKQVCQQVESKCQSQSEKDKFKTYIEDLEKIVRLLLNLSGQLARAENAVQALAPNADANMKKKTTDKRDFLHGKHEEAKGLKEDIDKRSDQLSILLRDRLDEGEFSDYTHYIKMKSKLTIELQELDDKITLGGEQISELKKSIPDYAVS